MEVIHVSAECYPVAKVGGLADVVGSLPRYQQASDLIAKVVMPMHRTKYLYEHEWEVVHKGNVTMGNAAYDFTVIKEKSNHLGFDLYCVDIFGLLDRSMVYGYEDDTDRFLAFQIAVCNWMASWNHLPDVVHVHDHHAALIPFMLRHCYAYRKLAPVPAVLTIHNAQYQGWMSWEKAGFLPAWDTWRWGLLEWDQTVNPLACGIKCADKVTTVSSGYLRELMYAANGLESLIVAEQSKFEGIINGIDQKTWNPETDHFISNHYDAEEVGPGKQANKDVLCKEFGLDPSLPLYIFIGRLVADKGSDLLAPFIRSAFSRFGKKLNFLILGSGDPEIADMLQSLDFPENCQMGFGYNEELSHRMYAGADFLLMPSRVEPCGLNQMYAMRYGTLPMVRKTGGLSDTVIDFEDEGGYGITFVHATVDDLLHAAERALALFRDKEKMASMRERMMQVDNSWEKRAENYSSLYRSVQRQTV